MPPSLRLSGGRPIPWLPPAEPGSPWEFPRPDNGAGVGLRKANASRGGRELPDLPRCSYVARKLPWLTVCAYHL